MMKGIPLLFILLLLFLCCPACSEINRKEPEKEIEKKFVSDEIRVDRDRFSLEQRSHFARGITGQKRVVVLLIEFQDVLHSSTYDKSYYENKVNGSKSLRTYYNEVSYNKFLIYNVTVSSWYKSAQNLAYYGAPSSGSHDSDTYRLVTEAVNLADAEIDFSNMDYLIVVHAGNDEARSHNPNDIWSHMGYDYDKPNVDGKTIEYYAMVAENSPIGTYAHEFGHLLFLPELYDTDYSSDGVGLWCLMAAGSELGAGYNGETPSHLCAWAKEKLGWVSPILVSSNRYKEPIEDVETTGKVYKLQIPSSSQYFLVENRQKKGFDSYLPGSGLLIWHIDPFKLGSWIPNNDEKHKGVDLEESTKEQHLDVIDYNFGDATDPWFLNSFGFRPDSEPNSDSYEGKKTGIGVINISNTAETMYADLIVDLWLYNFDMKLISESTKNLSPGEAATFEFKFENKGNDDILQLSIEGKYSSWGKLSTEKITLLEGYSAKGSITVTVPLNAPGGDKAEIAVIANSTGNPSYGKKIITTTNVNVIYKAVLSPSFTLLVRANSSYQKNITIENLGNVEDEITLKLSGFSDWVVYEGEKVLKVPAYSKKNITLTFNIPADVRGGDGGEVRIGGKSKNNAQAKEAIINLLVESYFAIRISGDGSKVIDAGVEEKFEVEISNNGTIATLVNLVAGFAKTEEGWDIKLSEKEFNLDAHSRKILNGYINVPDWEFGGKIVSAFIGAYADGIEEKHYISVKVRQIFDIELSGSLGKTVAAGETVEYFVNVKNVGNGEDYIEFSAYSDWKPSISIENATLLPYSSIDVIL
ncbi:MAG: M6 family metalloprotease domain-containing protein, partial [Candidatus Thermoplasmatota archaeon]